MKKVLQKSLQRLHTLLLLAVMFVVGGSAWAETVVVDLTATTPTAQHLAFKYGSYAKSNKGVEFYSNSSNYYMSMQAKDGYTITSVEFRDLSPYSSYCTIVFGTPYPDEGSFTTQTDEKWVWEYANGLEEIAFYSVNGGSNDFYCKTIEVTLKAAVPNDPIPYTINFVNAPDDAYITLDGETIRKENSGYTIAKYLNAGSVSYVYEPTGYYAEVTYDEVNHAFTITYVAGGRVSFGNSGEQKEGITYDPYWSGGSLYDTSYSGYGRVFFRTETKRINKIEILLDSDASPIFEENGFGTTVSNDNTVIWTAPAEGVATDICFYSTSSSGRNVVSSTVFYEDLPSIDYPIVIEIEGTLPGDFTPVVTVDGEDFSANGTHSTPKTLTKSNVSATTPANNDWYYDVDYNEGNHTFTVTYKEYFHYNVSVSGCTEQSAGIQINGDYHTYRDGDKINVKNVLNVADLTAVTVNGWTAGDITCVAPVPPVYGSVSVTYTEDAEQIYTVVFVNAPEGATVTVNNDKTIGRDDDDKTYTTRLTLKSDNFRASSVTGFDSNVELDNLTATVTYTAWPKYHVVVTGDLADANAGVTYSGTPYHDDEYIVEKYFNQNNIKTIYFPYYVDSFSYDDATKTITVNYEKVDYVYVDFTKITSVNADGITVSTDANSSSNSQGSGLNVYDGRTITITSEKAIDKIVFDGLAPYSYGGGHTLKVKSGGGSWQDGNSSVSPATWVAGADAYSVVFTNADGSDMWVHDMKIYIATPIEYHVNITGMPASAEAYAILNYDEENGKYTADGNYTYVTTAELYDTSLYLNYPASHKVSKTYDAETKTYDVTYTALTQYNVVADAENAYTGAGAGLKVNIGGGDFRWPTFGDTFYVDGTLEESAIQVLNVAGYNGSFVLDNAADPKTITVKYAEKENEIYIVKFAGDVPEDASVTITDAAGGHTVNYTDVDKTFLSRYTYTTDDVAPAMFEFYDADVDIDGTTITVNYTKVDYIFVDLTTDVRNGTKVTNKSTAETVSASFNTWDGLAEVCGSWPLTITSNTYNIVRIEYVKEYGYTNSGMTFNAGRWATEFEAWEANGAKTKTVELNAAYSGSDIYYSAVKVYLESPIAARISVDDDGWTSLCINEDFIVPDGYTAYTAGVDDNGAAVIVDNGEIILQEISAVPAGTAVLINGEGTDELVLERPINTPAAPAVNFLLGNPLDNTDWPWTAGEASTRSPGAFDTDIMDYKYGEFGACKLYKFSYDSNGENLGFYWGAEGGANLVCKPHKAFLVIPDSQAAGSNGFKIRFEDGLTTGIEGVAVEDAEAIYNLQGQRVLDTRKAGVYVKNGKKFIVK